MVMAPAEESLGLFGSAQHWSLGHQPRAPHIGPPCAARSLAWHRDGGWHEWCLHGYVWISGQPLLLSGKQLQQIQFHGCMEKALGMCMLNCPPPRRRVHPVSYHFFSSQTLAARFKTRHGLWLFESGARSLGAAEALHFLAFLDGGSDCSLALAFSLALALALGFASDGSAASS